MYMLALIGLGMLVSAIAKTQQQAFLGVFLITTPLILLSGYASPIDNMPGWLQVVTYLDPARYFLVIVQGLFLKAMPAAAVFHQLWPLALIACATLSASAWLFRARME
jgi:ABC-2 type transport system permease protein